MIVHQLTTLLSKDSEEVSTRVKGIQAMLDVATIVDPTLDHGDKRWGQDTDHYQSPCGDSASSITPLVGHGRDRDDRDMHDIIHKRDARDRIKNLCQEQDRIECKRRDERDYDYYGPYYDQPHRHRSPVRGCNEGGIKPFSRNLKRVCWPLYFKSSGIEKYNGSTNPAEWLTSSQEETCLKIGMPLISCN
jgi:hypothetical protein